MSVIIFAIGFWGYSRSEDFIDLLISMEIILLGLNLHLITLALLFSDASGIFYALGLLMLTVVESLIGLGLLVISFKGRAKTDLRSITYTRG